MSLSTIGPTSGKWLKIKLGKRYEASYRVDTGKFQEFTPVIHWRREGGAEQQTMLLPCVTHDQATVAAKRILAQLGYQPEVTTT